MPSTICPSLSLSRVCSLSSALSFSSSTRRDNTMLPRFLLNLMTLNRWFLPMSASRLRTGRKSTCDPGKKALTPPRIVTDRPPFTRVLIVPSINSSRSQAAEISSQTLRRSAFSLEMMQRPLASSRLSRKTSIWSPTFTVRVPSGPVNSCAGMVPSDLYPISTMMLSGPTLMTFPLTMSPSLTSSRLRDSSKSAAKLSSEVEG